MKHIQHLLDLKPRTKLRLSEIERIVRQHRIIVPPLSRRRLIEMCEDGTFETVGRHRPGETWLVFEDSFLRWVKSLE